MMSVAEMRLLIESLAKSGIGETGEIRRLLNFRIDQDDLQLPIISREKLVAMAVTAKETEILSEQLKVADKQADTAQHQADSQRIAASKPVSTSQPSKK